uniref:Uncharacterized protein n=1 Tax=viral metagenome TaxID=1070528 RepID=A0A6M3L2D2_9ZZZZ
MDEVIVTIDRPYYPDVQYFNDAIEANKYAEELVHDEQIKNGKYEVKVTVSKVISVKHIRTNY